MMRLGKLAVTGLCVLAIAGCNTGSRDGTNSGAAPGNPGGGTGTGGGGSTGGTISGTFDPAGTMQNPRGLHTATLLDDGRVLAVCGLTSGTQGASFVIENEVYDPTTNTWTNTSDPSLGGNPLGYMFVPVTPPGATQPQALPVPRAFHTATKMTNGQVLITGGFGFETIDAQGAPVQDVLATAFIFDPTTNQFAQTGSLNTPRQDHYAVALANNRVLIAGGSGQGQGLTLQSAEIFDASTGTFTPLSQTGQDLNIPRQWGAAESLNGGALLISGVAIAIDPQTGQPALFLANGAEAYDDTNGTFLNSAAPAQDRRFMASTVLSNGDIAIAGGDLGAANVFTSIEVFSNSAGIFNQVGDLQTARSRAGAARAGTTGNLMLVAGGTNFSGTAGTNELGDGELFNVATGAVLGAFPMASPRNSHTVTGLNDGRVLVAGGFSGGTDVLSLDGQAVGGAEVFTPR